jgi:hypothetical protein
MRCPEIGRPESTYCVHIPYGVWLQIRELSLLKEIVNNGYRG